MKTRAAKLIGKDYSTVYKATLNYPELARAVAAIKAEKDSQNLSKLEERAYARAFKEHKQDPKSASLIMFLLKSLDDKYKDKFVPGPGNINIILGFSIGGNGRPKTLEISPAGREITDAEVEEESPKPKKGRRASIDVLTEDELDV